VAGLSAAAAAPPADAPVDLLADAQCALRLFAADPAGLGGLWLRGGGPARDALVAALPDLLAGRRTLRRLPLSIDDDRLVGGVDLGASLAAGRPVRHAGLLGEAAGGILVVAGAERMSDAVAGRIAAAMDADATAALLLDDGDEDEDAPPPAVTERVAFRIDLAGVGRMPPRGDGPAAAPVDAAALAAVAAPDADVLRAVATAALAFGVASARTMIFALRAARASAALAGRRAIVAEDVTLAVRLVMVPVATRLPAADDEPPEAEPEPPPPDDAADPPPEEQREPEAAELPPLEDLVLEAVRATLPPELFDRLARDRARGRGPQRRGRGARSKAKLRGRPVGCRPGTPGGGLRLALAETLRAAAPWQRLRAAGPGRLRLRKDDFRVRRFESRETVLTIFAVDASGSAAFARLAEAKGAVELLLERAYAKRAEVALIAFRGTAAELLLPPTRSLTRARRLLAGLPGGGGTPLAAGLDAALLLAEGQAGRGRTPQLVVLTDGKANIAADGSQSRAQAGADAEAAARRIAFSGLPSVVIDIGPRRQPEAAAIARAMAGRYLHLPRGDAAQLSQALQ
jgi:magnesium chelatase subunit D